MGQHSQGARRVATGAAIAAVVASVLVGVGVGVGTAQEVPVAAAPVESPDTSVPEGSELRLPAVAPEPESAESESAAPTTAAAEPASPESASPESAAPQADESAAPETQPRAPSSIPARAAAGPSLVAGTPCTTTAKACVDLAERHAWLIEDGAIRRGPVSIMIGDEIDPTPQGTFAVEWKAEEWTSREYLTQMPYSVFFAEGGIAFHEGSQETNSAGCVKLTHDHAMAWFQYLQVGDEVQVR